MPGLGPGIHVLLVVSSTKKDVDGRDKPGHDGEQLNVQHQPRRIFQALLDAHEECDCLLAVDDAVIVGQRQICLLYTSDAADE